MLKPIPPITPNVMYNTGMLVANDETANAAAARMEPAIVIGRNPHRLAIALTNGPAIK